MWAEFITNLFSGDISLQQKMLSVGEVREQRSSFGAQRVFPGETSLKYKTMSGPFSLHCWFYLKKSNFKSSWKEKKIFFNPLRSHISYILLQIRKSVVCESSVKNIFFLCMDFVYLGNNWILRINKGQVFISVCHVIN